MSKYRWWIAGGLLFLTCLFSTGHHQGDEHFQIFEFAAYKLGLATTDDLAWEYDERMRPALQPAMVYAGYRLLGRGGAANPFFLAFLFRLLSAALMLTVAYLLYRRFRDQDDGRLLGAFGLLLLFHWCAYYSGVRFSSENWSGQLVALALLCYPLTGREDAQRFLPDGGRSALGAGALFALAFLCRYQSALLAAGFGLWLLLVYRERWQRLALTVLGGALTLAALYPLTYWLYGEWTVPAWNYLVANLVEGKAAAYGTRPWYGYLELVLLRGIPPLSVAYLGGTLLCWYAWRRDPIVWMSAVFVLVHSWLARKDIRFLFPLLPLLPVLLLGASAWLRRHYHWTTENDRGWVKWALRICWGVNLLLLASVVIRPAHGGIVPLKFIYDRYPGPTVLTGPAARLIVAEGTTPYFYSRPQHRLRPTESMVTDCGHPERPVCLYLLRSRDRPTAPPGSRLVYTDRPDLPQWIDVGNWLDRQAWHYVYEVGRSPD